METAKIEDLILSEKYQVMPDMSDEDREALTEEIRKNGVQVNIEIDDDMNVLDGFNRVQICRELEIDEVPVTVKSGLTEDEKLMHARALNIARRHLTAEQRRELIGDQLKETPEKSDRQIAKDLGVSDKTVGSQRKELERRAEIPHVDTVEDTAGRKQPREKKQPAPNSAASRYDPEELERAMNSLEGFDNDPFENTRSDKPADYSDDRSDDFGENIENENDADEPDNDTGMPKRKDIKAFEDGVDNAINALQDILYLKFEGVAMSADVRYWLQGRLMDVQDIVSEYTEEISAYDSGVENE